MLKNIYYNNMTWHNNMNTERKCVVVIVIIIIEKYTTSPLILNLGSNTQRVSPTMSTSTINRQPEH